MNAKKIKAKSDHVFSPDSVFDLFGSPPAFTSNSVFNPESCIQPKPHTKPKPRPYRQDSGHAFEHRIANVLNRNGIKAYVFPSEQGDNGIDIIATFNRQIILIQCKNTVKPIGVKILRDFQASVHRFGDAILSVVVYNSNKLKYNHLTKAAETWWKGSCPEICIETERTIVGCIKKRIAREKFKLIEELELEQESSEVESESEQESFESESESEQELLYFGEGSTHSAKQINYRSGQNSKQFIENLLNLLNENAIITNIFPQLRGDNGIDIIATFNRKIILIKCVNFNSPVYDNVLRDFQASIYRFGEGILSIIVYNSESDNPLIRNKGSHSKVKILNEKTIINYIKNNLTKKTPDHSKIASHLQKSSRDEYDKLLDDILSQFDQSVSHNDTPVVDRQQVLRSPELTPNGNMKVDEGGWENHDINSVERVRNDEVYYLGEQFDNYYEYDNGKLLNNVVKAPYGGNSSRDTTPVDKIPKTNNDSWSCPSCTFDNIQLMSRCEICLTDRPDTQQSQSFTPTEPTKPSSPQWSCPECTFMNESDVIMCIACDYFKDDD